MTNDKLAVTQKNIADSVLARVSEFQSTGELTIPQDYAPENALKSAWLILQQTKTKDGKPVLEVCSKESIANSLLDMVVQGLSPMKKHGDFIAYGQTLIWQREYAGNIALAKRFGNLKDIHANIIYEGDVFEFSVDTTTGLKKIIKHDQKLGNINNDKIKGAYAICIFDDGTSNVEIMNIDMIKKAWAQGAGGGNTGAHKNFPDEMAKKTVVNRACKLIYRSSDDAAIIVSRDNEDKVLVSSRDTIAENANQETIDTPVQVMESTQPEPEAKTETTEQKPLF